VGGGGKGKGEGEEGALGQHVGLAHRREGKGGEEGKGDGLGQGWC
jgi:hypothetical protein